MNNIKNLTKIYVKETFGTLFAKATKKKKTNGALGFVLVALLVVLIIGSMFGNFYGQVEMLKMFDMQNYILYYGLIYFSLISITLLSYQTQDLFYKTKDFNLLASLPVKSYQIITSKILSLFVISYLFEAVIVLPAIAVYYMYVGFNLIGFIYLIFTLLLLPVFTIFFSSVTVWVINILSSRAKNKKTANMSLLFAFMFVLLGFFLYVNYFGLSQIVAEDGVPLFLHIVLPTSSLMFWAVDEISLVMFGLYVLISLCFLFISVFLLSTSYTKINHNYQNKATSKQSKEGSFAEKSIFKSLLHMEFKNLLSKPMYIFNAVFGMFFLIIATVAMPIYFVANIETLTNPTTGILAMFSNNDLSMILAMLASSFVLLTCTSNSSISLEGQSIYFKKSLPIDFKDVALSKIVLNLIVNLPVVLFFLTSLPIMVYLGFNLWQIIFVLILPILAAIFTSVMGFVSNALFPRFDWTNVTVIVKQSMAVTVSLLLGMLIASAMFMIYFITGINPLIYSLLLIAFFVVAILGLSYFIVKKGENIYKKF